MIDFFVSTFEEVEELLTELSQNPWFFLLLFFVVLFDSVFPVLPSEFSVITGGVASGAGMLIDDQRALSVVLVVIIGALGALTGDSLGYVIVNKSDNFLLRFLFLGEKGEKRLEATTKQIRKRGGPVSYTHLTLPTKA